jgi:hypothetical protein
MRLPRVSIANLMVMVLTIAADFALLRQIRSCNHFDTAEERQGFLEAGGVFLMANILMVGLYRFVSRRNERKPFLIGFEVSGLVAMLTFIAWNRILPQQTEKIIVPVARFIYDIITIYMTEPLLVGTIIGLPLLIIALIGGLLSCQIAKPRWLAPADDPTPISNDSEPRSPTTSPSTVP